MKASQILMAFEELAEKYGGKSEMAPELEIINDAWWKCFYVSFNKYNV